MSHFILGAVVLQSPDLRNKFTTEAVKAASVQGLRLDFNAVLSTSVVADILKVLSAQGAHWDVAFSVLPPLPSDTADQLISPYVMFDDWPESIRGSLESLQEFICGVLELDAVFAVTLAFSEGYDVSYPVRLLEVDRMSDSLLEAFRSAGQVPSMAIEVRR